MTTNSRNPAPRTSAEEVIEMLEVLIDCIQPITLNSHATILEGVRNDSTEFVLKEAINHIRKESQS